MKKKIARIIILLLAVSAGIYGYHRMQKNRQSEMNGTLKIYGTIDIRDASLAFNEQERIVEILVEEGQRVKAGQLLARLQTNRLDAAISELDAKIAAQQEVVNRLVTGSRPQEIEQVKAEVGAADARVENARRLVHRLEGTVKTGATSKQDLDDAEAKLKVELAQLEVQKKALNLLLEGTRQEDIAAARHQLESLKANLELLKIRLGDTRLFAPSAGIIQSRILEVGELAGPSKPVFTLALTDPKWVRAYVPEPMLGRIKLGLKAEVFSDSFPDQPIPGWVGFISPVAEFTPRTVATEDLRTKLVYEARIFVKDPQDRLRLGMPVSVVVNEHEIIDPAAAKNETGGE